MGIKKWSNFNGEEPTNEKMKTFTGKNNDKSKMEDPKRSHVSASSEYADEINQNIVKQKKDVSSKQPDRKYATKKLEDTIKDDSLYPPKTEDRGVANLQENQKVKFYGKLAKFPDNVKAANAYNWMHNLKDPKLAKKDIWYLMVEKQDNELQMIKYQQKQGVNLTKFIFDLKKYYVEKYKDNKTLVENISNIELGGDKEGNVSTIRNIPNVTVENDTKLIQKITEDLVKLLG